MTKLAEPKAETAASPAPAPAAERVYGFDVARALAILGMVVVHFSLVMSDDDVPAPRWLATVLLFLDGRATATFVILAGIGITLMSRRAIASAEPASIRRARLVLVGRGLFLLALGFVNLIVWPGDILRVYGVGLMLAAALITAPSRRLLLTAGAFAVGFIVLFVTVDFEQNWDWNTLAYRNLWTPGGLVRNLLYDGFRSVFPWTGFILLGMWLGRLDLRDRAVNRRVLLTGLVTAVAAEVLSRLCERVLPARIVPGLSGETAHFLFGTESMPALPMFLLAAGGVAVAAIALCVRVVESRPTRAWLPLAATGQLALTWYVAHIVLGLGTVVALGLDGTQRPAVAAAYGVGFFAGAMLSSWLWKLRVRHGPLEWVMRKLAG